MKKILIASFLLVSPLFSTNSGATKSNSDLYINCNIVCPKCNSREINHTHINGGSTYYAVCRECGYKWYGRSSN